MEQKIRVIYNNESHLVDTMDDAQAIADKYQLDLVEMAPNVYKIMDYNKYLYNKKKSVKKQEKHEQKEAQFGAGIAQHDFNRKIKDIQKWLQRGATVRVIVTLKGREQAHPEIGINIIQRVIDTIQETQNITHTAISTSGRNILTSLSLNQ